MLVVASLTVPAAAAGASSLPGAPGCPMFPADSYWHARVDGLPRDPASDTYVANAGAGSALHADFGAGLYDGGPIGIPFTTVGAGQPEVPVGFEYDDESDPGPYPIPPSAPIEGGAGSDGDRHVLVVDRDACRDYEVYAAYPNGGGTSWSAGSGAVFRRLCRSPATARSAKFSAGAAARTRGRKGPYRKPPVSSGSI